MRLYDEYMRLPEEYMLTHDIDWFCFVNRRYLIHFASNGSLIPEFAANVEQLFFAQRAVIRLPFLRHNELRYNRRHIEELSRLEDYDEIRYLDSFELFANKGFYSFDYEWDEERREGEYKLIVGPSYSDIDIFLDNFLQFLPQVSTRDMEMFRGIMNQIESL